MLYGPDVAHISKTDFDMDYGKSKAVSHGGASHSLPSRLEK